MSAGRSLEARVVDRGGETEVILRGSISERALMDPEIIPANRRVVIDASGVAGINSFGVRTWVNFLAAVCAKSSEVTIRQLPPVLVTQASMVANFLQRARVESFYSPWSCLDCMHEELLLHGVDDELPRSTECSKCGGPMEFDGIASSYLAFREGL